MYAIAIKLHTLVQCHKVTLLNKFHNTELNINEIIYLKILVKLFQLPGVDSVILTLFSHIVFHLYFFSLSFHPDDLAFKIVELCCPLTSLV